MPYVEQARRPALNNIVDSLANASVCANGDLNYILYKYCKDYVEAGYNNYKNYIGELEEAVAEIRRCILAPYEDQKRKENGDV